MKKVLGIALFILCLCIGMQCYAKMSENDCIENGNIFLRNVENSQNPELNSMYLNKAKYYFYTASRKKPPSAEALTGLARVYTIQNKYDDAKNAFFRAISVDPYNSSTNFYFAEFYYKNDEFIKALQYYEKAQKRGFSDRVKNQEMINKCSAKLGIGEYPQE